MPETRNPAPTKTPRPDTTDRMILRELIEDSRQTLETLSRKIGTTKTPIWNRINRLRSTGVIKRFSVELDAEKLGYEACFFVLVRTSEHEAEWQKKFLQSIRKRPEVLEAHRLAGDVDYILKVLVANAKSYDALYQELIKDVKIFNVTALLSMEEIKSFSNPAI